MQHTTFFPTMNYSISEDLNYGQLLQSGATRLYLGRCTGPNKFAQIGHALFILFFFRSTTGEQIVTLCERLETNETVLSLNFYGKQLQK